MKRENQRKRIRLFQIMKTFLLILICFICGIGLIFLVVAKSGKARFAENAGEELPAVKSDEISPELQAQLESLKTVQWQDGWVAYNNKVYEYNDDLLNFLIMGIDVKGEVSKEDDYGNWEAGQADAIFVVSLDAKERIMKIVAVPRNAMVNVNLYDENNEITDTIYNQICLQYAYGGGGENSRKLMKDSVSELLYGLPISGVCAVGFKSVPIMNDMVGGVDVEVLEDLTQFDRDFVQGNRLHLEGNKALLYIQRRDVTVLGSPTGRLQRQKQYITALMKQTVAELKKNPMLAKEIYDAIMPYMNTDITLDETVYLSSLLPDLQFSEDSIYQLQGEDKRVDYIDEWGNADFYDDYYLYEDSVRDTVMEVFYKEVVLQ